jgi:hypothetical protein
MQPSGLLVQSLVSVGTPVTAAARAEGPGAATTGRGEARPRRGAATDVTAVTT